MPPLLASNITGHWSTTGSLPCLPYVRLLFHYHRRHHGFTDHLIIYVCLPLHFPERRTLLEYFDFQAELIPRHDRSPEFCLVDTRQIHDGFSDRPSRLEHQHATHLSHGLDNQHPWHDRASWEMSLKERLIHRHIFEPHDPLMRFKLFDSIHQQERIPMGK